MKLTRDSCDCAEWGKWWKYTRPFMEYNADLDNFEWCPWCGEELIEPNQCREKPLPDIFCDKCGTLLHYDQMKCSWCQQKNPHFEPVIPPGPEEQKLDSAAHEMLREELDVDEKPEDSRYSGDGETKVFPHRFPEGLWGRTSLDMFGSESVEKWEKL